ncbi:MAG: aminoacyl-tRNA hydrolase [Patescibacteria group bacterium]
MTLIVGLGNPGQKYEETRHNIGFRIIDKLKREENFPDFSLDNKFNGLLTKEGDVVLLKPQTFMNKSGVSVSNFARYYNVNSKDIVIIHDDSDINLGKIKIDKNRSSGGHNGVQSIINHLSTKNFWRIRFGIGKENKKAGEIALKKFSKEEEKLVNKLVERTIKEIKKGLKEGFEKKSFQEKN